MAFLTPPFLKLVELGELILGQDRFEPTPGASPTPLGRLLTPLLGSRFLKLGPWLRGQVHANAVECRLSVRQASTIAWAPIAMLTAGLTYLALGFVRSPQWPVLRTDHFQPGYWNGYVWSEYSVVQFLGFTTLLVAGVAGMTVSANPPVSATSGTVPYFRP